MTKATIDLGSPFWEGGAGIRLRPLAQAHAIGALELDPGIVGAITRVTELADAEHAAHLEASDAESRASEAHSAAIARLVADGPSPAPSAPIRASHEALTAARQDADILHQAVTGAMLEATRRFIAEAQPTAGRLAVALRSTLEAATSDAELVDAVRIDYANPASLHEAPPDVAAAFHRLEQLATRHDRIRQAALALYSMLSAGTSSDGLARSRRAVLAELDQAASTRGPRQDATGEWISTFLGGGIVGPAWSTYNKGADPLRARAWAWKPTGHPVQRLIGAALAPVPGPVEPGAEPEPTSRRPVLSTGVRR